MKRERVKDWKVEKILTTKRMQDMLAVTKERTLTIKHIERMDSTQNGLILGDLTARLSTRSRFSGSFFLTVKTCQHIALDKNNVHINLHMLS